jgi:hypothetical protein
MKALAFGAFGSCKHASYASREVSSGPSCSADGGWRSRVDWFAAGAGVEVRRPAGDREGIIECSTLSANRFRRGHVGHQLKRRPSVWSPCDPGTSALAASSRASVSVLSKLAVISSRPEAVKAIPVTPSGCPETAPPCAPTSAEHLGVRA